ncbi:MAG TPA: purine-nucleoside phosphorylase, partial [Gemmatimonadales bacterium]|nr:purine-nucleoside phosphorylase [Gemmatimonadales bacterium]
MGPGVGGRRSKEVAAAAEAVRARLGPRRPAVGIVLGSGLGALADRVAGAVRIPYADIPGFPPPTVEGHRGELVAGTLAGMPVVVQSGRFHLYEGHDAATVALPVRVFAELGVRTLVVTSASGGVRRSFAAGTLMLIADHLNLTGRNPLVGGMLAGEPRFPDMTEPYDAGLRAIAREGAAALELRLEEGVYAGLLGPSYETAAEVRWLERIGADAVGMSIVTEVIAARARGLRCLGFTLVTNPAAGLGASPISHEEVIETASRAGGDLARLVEWVVGRGTGNGGRGTGS